MTDRHRPFARTHEAAQQAEAKRGGERAAPDRRFERTAALSSDAPPGVSPGAPRGAMRGRMSGDMPGTMPGAYEAASTFAVNRLERRPMPRRRLPWLLTGVVAIICGQIVWWAYQEVDGEPPVTTVREEAPPITEAAFEPPTADPPDAVAAVWPPIPQEKPANGWATTVSQPPKPVLKPR